MSSFFFFLLCFCCFPSHPVTLDLDGSFGITSGHLLFVCDGIMQDALFQLLDWEKGVPIIRCCRSVLYTLNGQMMI